MKNFAILIILLLFLNSCATHVIHGPDELGKALVNDPKIRSGILENGLRYMIRHNDKPEKKVEFRLGVNIGSLQEGDGEEGAAHFIEHMAFNGTDHFTQRELLDFFQENGMQFGADLNALTSHTKTVYRFSLPTDNKEVINRGLLLLKDWASGIKFQKDEVDKERNIILEEMRARKSVKKRVREKIFPYVYGSEWADRHPIGKSRVIKTIGHEKLKALYKKWYQPGSISIVVVGDIDVDEIEAKIKTIFFGLENKKPILEAKTFDIPKYKKVQYLSVEDQELTQSFIKIYQNVKTKKIFTQGDLRRFLVEKLYIKILHDRLKEKSLSAASSFDQLLYFQFWQTPRDKVFYLGARVKGSKFEQAFADILLELERIRRYGVLDFEMESAKKKYTSKHLDTFTRGQYKKIRFICQPVYPKSS